MKKKLDELMPCVSVPLGSCPPHRFAYPTTSHIAFSSFFPSSLTLGTNISAAAAPMAQETNLSLLLVHASATHTEAHPSSKNLTCVFSPFLFLLLAPLSLWAPC